MTEEAYVPLAEFFQRELAALDRGRPQALIALVDEPRVVSVGVGVPEQCGYLARARDAGIAVLRRHTGGTGLLHVRGDIVWSLVLPRADLRAGRDFVRAYRRLGGPVTACLGAFGVTAAWAAPPAISDEYCTLGSRGEVLASGSAILGGAAQHATAGALLHHGTVSWTVDRPLTDRLFGWVSTSPSGRLHGLRELGVPLGPEALAARLEAELRSYVTAGPEPG